MAMKRCESGHYFDTGKHVVCPLCSAVNVDQSIKPQQAAPVTPPMGGGKTVAIMKKEKGIDPVVGWFVCINGPDKGNDYRIKGEKNFVGRAANMDIAIQHDETISRENHVAVSYNPKKRGFKILPGEGRGIVYLNGDEVDGPKDLSKGDRIEIGQTTLMFVPLCGEEFDWD